MKPGRVRVLVAVMVGALLLANCATDTLEEPSQESGAGPSDGGSAAGPDVGEPDYPPYEEWVDFDVIIPRGEFIDVSMTRTGYSGCGVRVGGELKCWGDWLPYPLPTGEFATVSSADSFGCALGADGSLVCWPPTRWEWLDELADVEVPDGEFVDVSVSRASSCAVRVGGELVCWGDGRYGQLEVPDGEFSQVFAGPRSCGLTVGGGLVCWGDIWARGVMDQVPRQGYRSVSEGGGSACAVDDSGVLWCWGTYPFLANVGIPGREFVYREVSVANPGVCALKADGDAVCWRTGVDVLDTTRVGPFEQISVSGGVACALRSGGEAECWGERPRGTSDGGRGDEPGDWERPRSKFTQVVAYGRDGAYACGIRADSTIGCWDHRSRDDWAGEGPMGWMASKPDQAGFDAVAVAQSRACALGTGGAVVCWGAAHDNTAAEAPSGVWSPPGEYTQITATDQDNRGQFCGLRADESLLCWSDPDELTTHSVEWARLGTGGCGIRPDEQIECRAHVYRDEPPDRTGPLTRAAVGPREACGIRSADSSIACWSKHSGLPTEAPTGTYTNIAASSYSGFCAIATDGSLACWDTNLHIYSPSQREYRQHLLDAPADQFIELAVGSDHACAIRADKTLTCWGPDGYWVTITPEPSGP